MDFRFLIEQFVFLGLFFTSLFFILISLLVSPFFRARRMARFVNKDGDEQWDGTYPDVSVVVLASDREDDFEDKIAALTEQAYPASYRIIIVADMGDTLVERIRDKYVGDARVYCTFVPTSSRYMNRKKLAISIGVKAVMTEWFVVLEADCTPQSAYWLVSMAKNFTSENCLVLGYSHYANDARGYYHFYNILQYCLLFRDMSKGQPYRNYGMNFATTKSYFEQEVVLRRHLHLLCGEYDLIVNNAAPRRCAMELSEASWMRQETPSAVQWERMRLNYWETRRWLRHGSRRRFLFNLYQFSLHVSFLFLLAGSLYAGLVQAYWALACFGFLFLLVVVLRTLSIHLVAKALKINLPILGLPLYELRIFWSQLFSYFRYKKAGKHEFKVKYK